MRLFLFLAILLSVTDELWADQVCCPGLRCYDNSPPFDDRPLPQCPEEMDVQMTVYTRQNSTSGEIITRNTIPATFKDNVMTMFIVHGWMQVPIITWMIDMKDAALKHGDYNVIIVIWRGAFHHLFYDQSASNTRTVGGEIALIVNNTINKGKSSKALTYCVGHSLGAHVCGHAGNWGQIGRITGMDPANFRFENNDPSVGLNPSCADLVDNIHTNDESFPTLGTGIKKAIGHIDFYLNQIVYHPSCMLNPYRKFVPKMGDFLTCDDEIETCIPDFQVSCDHLRAIYLFTESISSPCFLSHFRCSDPHNTPESCTESTEAVQSLGFNANEYPGRGIFYLETKACSPFCCKPN